MIAAMGLGVRAIERRQDFEGAVTRLARARDEEQRLQIARQRGREEALREE
ncbi:MAG: hypothetical protein AAF367_13565 [Pseudomonadota bacterium]